MTASRWCRRSAGARRVARVDTTTLRHGTGSVTALSGLDWSPDGSRLAWTVGYNGDSVTVLTLASGKTLTLPAPLAAFSPAWSPDGRSIAVAAGDPAFIFGAGYFGNAWRLGALDCPPRREGPDPHYNRQFAERGTAVVTRRARPVLGLGSRRQPGHLSPAHRRGRGDGRNAPASHHRYRRAGDQPEPEGRANGIFPAHHVFQVPGPFRCPHAAPSPFAAQPVSRQGTRPSRMWTCRVTAAGWSSTPTGVATPTCTSCPRPVATRGRSPRSSRRLQRRLVTRRPQDPLSLTPQRQPRHLFRGRRRDRTDPVDLRSIRGTRSSLGTGWRGYPLSGVRAGGETGIRHPASGCRCAHGVH